MMWKLRFLLFLFFMLWWLGALPGQAAEPNCWPYTCDELHALAAEKLDTWRGPDFGEDPPVTIELVECDQRGRRSCSTIPEELDRVLELVRPAAPGERIAGTFFPDTGELVIADREPDGIRRGRATADRHGQAWNDGGDNWIELLESRGATDSDRECRAKVEKLCKDHGGASKMKLASVTTHEGDGCRTCSGDCANNGAVAFITETGAACAERKKRDGKRTG